MRWGGVTVAVGAATVPLSPSRRRGRALDRSRTIQRDAELMKKQVGDCFEL